LNKADQFFPRRDQFWGGFGSQDFFEGNEQVFEENWVVLWFDSESNVFVGDSSKMDVHHFQVVGSLGE